MTVTYLPPVSTAPVDDRVVEEAISEGPAYARTRTMGRWHRIRSGRRWIAEWRPDELRESYDFWCGYATGSYANPIFTETPPVGEPACGTCEGRARGADPDHTEWLFQPRGLTPPKVCPGSQTRAVIEDPTNFRRATCLFCGDDVKMRAFGGPWTGDWGAQRHPPGPGLPPGCPLHGWRQLVIRDGAPVCRCGGPT